MANNKYDYLYARFNGARGLDSEKLRDLQNDGKLTIGTYYKVERINMGRSITSIKLQNIDKSLNSVAFDFFFLQGGLIRSADIYSDPRFNPYMEVDFEK